ncbi:hypothetical protein COBT_001317 [Conglomerata obtusa]
MVDYFSRIINSRILRSRTSKEIIRVLEEMFLELECPEMIIIKNRQTTIEAHTSNGRIERVIRSVREQMLKMNVNDFDEKLKTVISSYNDTFHTGIGCTPNEAYCDISGKARIENSVDSKYQKLFKEKKNVKLLSIKK